MREIHALSRNCRNSKAIYSGMRSLVGGLPKAEPALEGGRLLISKGPQAKVVTMLNELIVELQITPDDDLVILTMEGREHEIADDADVIRFTPKQPSWQQFVTSIFEHRLEGERWLADLWDGDSSAYGDVLESFVRSISDEPFPTHDDVTAVAEMARTVALWTGLSDQDMLNLVRQSQIVIGNRQWALRPRASPAGRERGNCPSTPWDLGRGHDEASLQQSGRGSTESRQARRSPGDIHPGVQGA